MAQDAFDFSQPVVNPQTDSWTAPINGTTPRARHASYTGKIHACEARGEKVEALRQLLANHGPLTLNTCAVMLGYPLSSICSLKAALGDQVVPDGFELITWDVGKATRRTTWRIQQGA